MNARTRNSPPQLGAKPGCSLHSGNREQKCRLSGPAIKESDQGKLSLVAGYPVRAGTSALPVGVTVDAEMLCGRKVEGQVSSFSAEPNVSSTKEFVKKSGVTLSPSTQIVFDSLIWPILARKGKFKTQKDFGKFGRSAVELAKCLQHYESRDFKENTELFRKDYVQDIVKFFNDTLLCRVAGDATLPGEPACYDGTKLYTGYIKVFIDRKVLKHDTGFIYSLQKGTKQAWPALGWSKMLSALEKHSKRLSRPRVGIPDDLRKMIGIVSRETFQNIDTKLLVKCLPSAAACYESSRADSGHLGLFEPIPQIKDLKEQIFKVKLRRTRILKGDKFILPGLSDDPEHCGKTLCHLYPLCNAQLPGFHSEAPEEIAFNETAYGCSVYGYHAAVAHAVIPSFSERREVVTEYHVINYFPLGRGILPADILKKILFMAGLCSLGPDLGLPQFWDATLYRRFPDFKLNVQKQINLNLFSYRKRVFQESGTEFERQYLEHKIRMQYISECRASPSNCGRSVERDLLVQLCCFEARNDWACDNVHAAMDLWGAEREEDIIEPEDARLPGEDDYISTILGLDQFDFHWWVCNSKILRCEGGPVKGVNDVSVVAIPEPGKYRIISKGNGYANTYVQPLQGAMIDCIKNAKWSTMRDQDLTEHVNSIYGEMKEVTKVIRSVDYEAATDLLNVECTEACIVGLPEDVQGIATRAFDMDGSCVDYSNLLRGYNKSLKKERAGVKSVHIRLLDVPFTNGQLMGHPLSFPFLCVVNRAVYLTTLNRWVQKRYALPIQLAPDCTKAAWRTKFEHWEIDTDVDTLYHLTVNDWVRDQLSERDRLTELLSRNLIVNGDDMLFMPPDEEFCSIFSQVSSAAGFLSSKGKDYKSEQLAMINSQVFHLRKGGLERVGYLNQRFLFGNNVKKGATGSQEKSFDSHADSSRASRPAKATSACTPTDVAKDVNKMVSLAPWTGAVVPAIMRRFKLKRRVNWYLPRHLGGIGLDLSQVPFTRVTREQRQFAAEFVAHPEFDLFYKVGRKLNVAKVAKTLLKYRMVPYEEGPLEPGSSLDSNDAWLNRLAYYTQCEGPYLGDLDVFELRRSTDYRLKPMSFEGIEKYWRVNYISQDTLPCPSFGVLKYC